MLKRPFLVSLTVFWAWMGIVAPGLLGACQAKRLATVSTHSCCQDSNPCGARLTAKPCCEAQQAIPPAQPLSLAKASLEIPSLNSGSPLVFLDAFASNRGPGFIVESIPGVAPPFLLKHSFLC